jgi:hypothetical protein
MTAPSFVAYFVLLGNAAIIIAALGGLNLALYRADWPESGRRSIMLTATITLIGWFTAAFTLSYVGAFRGEADHWPTIQFGILVPIAIGLILLWRSERVQNVIDIVPQSWIVGIQFYRVLGMIFIILLSMSHLPPQFALPAGWGDVAIGLLAPFIGLAYSHGIVGSRREVLVWNIVGIFDLVVAVGTGFLTSPSPFRILALDAPNQLISAFPLVLIPVFAVPVSVLLHAVSLIKLAKANKAREHEPFLAT